MKEYNVAIAGATGAVGRVFLSILEERNFPVKTLLPLASQRSSGKKIVFKNEEFEVRELQKKSFSNIDIALFSAGASISREFAKYAAESGAVVVDNSSAFRMEDDVPLVVPEVNKKDIFKHKGIIANPNCSTIIMSVAIKPIYDLSPITRIVASTYQAVSGAGAKAILELEEQTKKIICLKEKDVESRVFPVQIAFNVIPHIDIFLDNGYTKEEMKMVNETRKIFNNKYINVSATTVRVPVFTSHSESLNIETKDKITIEAARQALGNAEGIILKDDFRNCIYPTTLDSSSKDDVYVGRIREDISVKNGICLWVVGDQLRKGAALNAIQIAEILISNDEIT
ncbi:MAG: aspartate-semialdehyde dehydrogenase [Actinobacteria bacterium]|nr:aspartate-semialdehyde dehydrogenase [Actinomycetota bacterium]